MQAATIEVSADLAEWERIRQFLASYCESNSISGATCKSMQLACEEWFINVVVHGFKNGAKGAGEPPYICLSLSLGGSGEIRAVLTDNATPFNPLEHETPDISLPVADRSIGGLGIYLMLKQAERAAYRQTEGKNELTLWFKIRQDEQTGE